MVKSESSSEVLASYSAVAKAYKRLQEEIGKKRRLRAMIKRIQEDMSNVKG